MHLQNGSTHTHVRRKLADVSKARSVILKWLNENHNPTLEGENCACVSLWGRTPGHLGFYSQLDDYCRTFRLSDYDVPVEVQSGKLDIVDDPDAAEVLGLAIKHLAAEGKIVRIELNPRSDYCGNTLLYRLAP